MLTNPDRVTYSKFAKANELLKKEVRDLVGEYLPHIPRFGLLCGEMITFSQIVNDRKYFNEEKPTDNVKINEPSNINLDDSEVSYTNMYVKLKSWVK